MSKLRIENGPYAGWYRWDVAADGRFGDSLGVLYFRPCGNGRETECRLETGRHHSNWQDSLHGGFLMAFIDQALFAIAEPSVGGLGRAVTLTCNTEFLGAGRHGSPIDAKGEILRETGRLLFIRGLVTQEGEPICAFSGTLRKARQPS